MKLAPLFGFSRAGNSKIKMEMEIEIDTVTTTSVATTDVSLLFLNGFLLCNHGLEFFR